MTQNTTQESPQQALSTSSIGRHSELLAMAALIANGWSVSEPTVPEAHDLEARKGALSIRVQVKTIKTRERDGTLYYVIRGTKNSGQVYDSSDCDAFVGVIDGRVYMTETRNISEYWVRAEEVAEKWAELSVNITKAEAV